MLPQFHSGMTDSQLIGRIKLELKQRGLSQREFASMLGKKEAEISRWFSGRTGIGGNNLRRIEDILDIDLSRNGGQKNVNQTIRIGIVGTGSIAGRFVCEAAHVPGTIINAAYNPDGTQLDLFCKKFGIGLRAGDYGQLLQNCDAVYVASPIATHYEYAKAALENNKHVLCEMPFTYSKTEAAELFKIAEKRGLVLIPALKTAFCPSFLKLVQIVQSGEIGDIADVSATVTTLLPASTDFEKNEELIRENATYSILLAFVFFGIKPNKITNFQKDIEGKVIFAHSIMDYGKAVVSIKTGTGVKSEGSLVISGTKGYIYVPSPWWKTDYFEVRRENPANNQKYYFPFEADGLRYEISVFKEAITDRINTEEYISPEETIKMVDLQSKLF